jgi:hypothetical protein
MDEQLKSIENQLEGRNFDSPPLHLWHPPLSGDIAIKITADGTWYHDGGKIERESIVRLFAAILRREDDGEYYLVTPGEKWRIEVESHPLLVVDVERKSDDVRGEISATLNTGKQLIVGREHPLELDEDLGGVAFLKLDHGLTALFSRAAWYRLVDMAEHNEQSALLVSGGYHHILG